MVGASANGRPVFGFNVVEVGPPRFVAAVAATSLASGRPVAGAKSVPLFTARVPGFYDSWRGSFQVRASVQKKEGARRAAALAGAGAGAGGAAGRTTSSSLDLLDGGAAAAAKAEKNGDIFGPRTLDFSELSFVLDV